MQRWCKAAESSSAVMATGKYCAYAMLPEELHLLSQSKKLNPKGCRHKLALEKNICWLPTVQILACLCFSNARLMQTCTKREINTASSIMSHLFCSSTNNWNRFWNLVVFDHSLIPCWMKLLKSFLRSNFFIWNTGSQKACKVYRKSDFHQHCSLQ